MQSAETPFFDFVKYVWKLLSKRRECEIWLCGNDWVILVLEPNPGFNQFSGIKVMGLDEWKTND